MPPPWRSSSGSDERHRRRFEVAYWLFDVMDFFGYTDGSAPRLVLGTAPLDEEGRFEMAVPNFLHDPFIEQPTRSAEILIRLDDPEENSIEYSLPLVEQSAS